MLYHPRVECLNLPRDRDSGLVKPLVTKSVPARHDSAHSRHRETSLEALFLLNPQWSKHGIYQDRFGHLLDIGIAQIALNSEYDDPQIDSDMWRSKACPVQVHHGVSHICHDHAEFRSVKFDHFAAALKQSWIPHSQHLSDHDVTSASRMSVTVPFASPMAFSMSCT